MDSLVFKKYDLNKKRVLDQLERDITSKRNEFAARGVLRSSSVINTVGDLMVRSAHDNVELLLKTYEEVGQLINDEAFIIEKESEIRAEVDKLVASEGQRVSEGVNELVKSIGIGQPRAAGNFYINLQNEARDRAEILIEITKRRIINSRPKKSFTDHVFVIMQIGDPQLDKIWKDVYAPVIGDFKLNPKRIDKHNEGRFLMSEVAGYLNNSKLVIADLTNARPNCYLEVGYTLGIDKNSHLILCARDDHRADSPKFKPGGPKVHFDIGGYDIIWWDEAKIDDFKLDLAKKIRYRLTVIEK